MFTREADLSLSEVNIFCQFPIAQNRYRFRRYKILNDGCQTGHRWVRQTVPKWRFFFEEGREKHLPNPTVCPVRYSNRISTNGPHFPLGLRDHRCFTFGRRFHPRAIHDEPFVNAPNFGTDGLESSTARWIKKNLDIYFHYIHPLNISIVLFTRFKRKGCSDTFKIAPSTRQGSR